MSDNFFTSNYENINKKQIRKQQERKQDLTQEFAPKRITQDINKEQFLITRIDKQYIKKFNDLAKYKNLKYGDLFVYLIRHYEKD